MFYKPIEVPDPTTSGDKHQPNPRECQTDVKGGVPSMQGSLSAGQMPPPNTCGPVGQNVPARITQDSPGVHQVEPLNLNTPESGNLNNPSSSLGSQGIEATKLNRTKVGPALLNTEKVPRTECIPGPPNGGQRVEVDESQQISSAGVGVEFTPRGTHRINYVKNPLGSTHANMYEFDLNRLNSHPHVVQRIQVSFCSYNF